MANEFLKNYKITDNGSISLNSSVFEEIIISALQDDSTISFSRKDVVCHITEEGLTVDLFIKAVRDLNYPSKGEELQESLFSKINELTDIKCFNININFTGFII